MTTQNLIDGLLLLKNYRDKPGYDAGAEHDVLYGYATDKPLSNDDVETMIALGWHQESDNIDYSEGEEFSVKYYDPDESWVFYT